MSKKVAVIVCSGQCAELYDPEQWKGATVYVVNEMAAKVEGGYDYACFLDNVTQEKLIRDHGHMVEPRKGLVCVNATFELARKGKAPGLASIDGLECIRLLEDLRPTKHNFWQNWSFTTAVYVAVTVHGHNEIHLFGVDHEGQVDGYGGVKKKASWNPTRWDQEKRNFASMVGEFKRDYPGTAIIRHLYSGTRYDMRPAGMPREETPTETVAIIETPKPRRAHRESVSVEALGLSSRCVKSLMKNNITNCHRLLAVASGPNGIEDLIDRVWGIHKRNIDEVLALARKLEAE